MKHPIITVLTFLLLGTLINVAVAWGASLTSPYGDLSKIEQGAVQALWSRYAPPHWPALDNDYDGGVRSESFLRMFLRTGPTGPHIPVAARDTGIHAYYVHSVTVGWPFRSLEGGFAFTDSNSEINNKEYLTNLYIWGHSDRDVVWFPIGVIWPGAVINTFFYAAILWILVCGPFVLRRYFRKKRSLCPACGYPRGKSPVCSECGAQLVNATTTA